MCILAHVYHNILYICVHIFHLGDKITLYKIREKNTHGEIDRDTDADKERPTTKKQVTLFALDKNKNALYLSKR